MTSIQDAERVARTLELVRYEASKAIRGLNETQERVLFAIEDYAPVTDARLVAVLGMDKSQLSKAVAALIVGGFVDSTPSQKHKTQRDLFLTEEGRKQVEGLESGQIANGLFKFVEKIGENGRSHLKALAEEMGKIVVPAQRSNPNLILRLADQQDLVWLLGQWARNTKDGHPLSTLLNGTCELVEHLNFNVDREHRWVLLENGARVGGAVLTTDRDEPANAWIGLLYASDANREASRRLVRKAQDAAVLQGYEWLRIKVLESDAMTREVLGEAGFQPVAKEKIMLLGGSKMRMTYGVQLLPELDT